MKKAKVRKRHVLTKGDGEETEKKVKLERKLKGKIMNQKERKNK